MGKAKYENGMYKITDKQMELIKELRQTMLGITAETDDQVFNDYIYDLQIFKTDLEEVLYTLIDSTI